MNGVGVAGVIAALTGAPAPDRGDGTVASLVAISGNVLVSRDFSIASAVEPERLAPGTRVLVTLNSSAIVVFDDGRWARLSGGERIEVAEVHPCAGARE